MADAVSGATGKLAMHMFGPSPSITIVTFWQGIVEILLRGISGVIAFICIITAAVSLSDLDISSTNLEFFDNAFSGFENTVDLSRSACGFLIFIAIVVIVIEGLIIAQRFLNFGIVHKFVTVFIIADIVISGVFAFLFFCLAIATAVYSSRFRNWEEDANDSIRAFREFYDDHASSLDEDLGSVSFFCFVNLFVFAGLGAFMAVSFLLRWRNSQAKYATTGGGVMGGNPGDL